MRLDNPVNIPSFKSFNLIAIGCFQRCKHCYVTELEFVRGMRGKAAQDDVILEAELHDLEGFMRTETDMCNRNLTTAFSSDGVRYCWLWFFSSFERRPFAR